MKLLTCLLLPAATITFAALEDHITEYDLPNGLHVIIYADSSAPVVSTNVFYKVGAYDELPGHTGLSHMLEHMTFKHSNRYTPGTFHRMVDSAGGYNNGFTSTYYTGYYEDLASDRWEFALELEAARMSSCRFDSAEFASEHQVVTEEWRLGENRPASRFWKEFEAVCYSVHPQRQPIIGYGDDISNFTAQKAEAWYRRHYNPANAVLVIAGDVRVDQARKLVGRHFEGLKGTPVERADYYNLEPEQRSERRLVVRDEVQEPAVRIGWHNAGIRDPDAFAGDVAAGILAHGRSSRLYRLLVTENRLATQVSGANYFSRDPGLFSLYIRPVSEEAIPEIERIVDQEVARLRTELVAGRELEKVRNQVLADQIFDKDDISDLAYYLAMYHITQGTWRGFERYAERVRAVAREDVKQFCVDYLKHDNKTTGLLLPRKDEG
ncbi:MAG: insulinase family protein [candidate division WOR-3 bacterium]|nr:MAG: insulinase family protein [candidate division WOR-3 bacterium]